MTRNIIAFRGDNQSIKVGGRGRRARCAARGVVPRWGGRLAWAQFVFITQRQHAQLSSQLRIEVQNTRAAETNSNTSRCDFILPAANPDQFPDKPTHCAWNSAIGRMRPAPSQRNFSTALAVCEDAQRKVCIKAAIKDVSPRETGEKIRPPGDPSLSPTPPCRALTHTENVATLFAIS